MVVLIHSFPLISFDSYGLGFSLTSELGRTHLGVNNLEEPPLIFSLLEHNADVVDLLVTITVAAAKNRRYGFFCLLTASPGCCGCALNVYDLVKAQRS